MFASSLYAASEIFQKREGAVLKSICFIDIIYNLSKCAHDVRKIVEANNE